MPESLPRARTVAVVICMPNNIERAVADPFIQDMLTHVLDALFCRDAQALVLRKSRPEPGWFDDLVDKSRPDGVIMLGQGDQHGALKQIAASWFPLIVWGERQPDQTYCTVGVDNLVGGRLATEHLLSLGRRNLLFVGDCGAPEIAARHTGFLQAIKASGTPPESHRQVASQFDFASAHVAITKEIRAGARFDAIFAASDMIASGIYAALAAAGRNVPEDVAIVGYDDIPEAPHFDPPLTSVRQNLPVAARTMVELLFKRMMGQQTDSVIVPTSLVVRGSTRPKPKARDHAPLERRPPML